MTTVLRHAEIMQIEIMQIRSPLIRNRLAVNGCYSSIFVFHSSIHSPFLP